jgi:hypothetical protein
LPAIAVLVRTGDMDNATKLKDIDALRERLSELDITVAKGADAKLCVFTTCEPLFCFEANSEDELIRLVEETLDSYITTFYQVEVESVTIRTRKVPLSVPQVPVFPVEPLSKLLLNFNNMGHAQGAHAW